MNILIYNIILKNFNKKFVYILLFYYFTYSFIIL